MPCAMSDSGAAQGGRRTPAGLLLARALTLGPVVLAFPLATYAVFGLDIDRDRMADVVAVVYSVGLFTAFSSALWPLPRLREWSALQRIESLCMLFLAVSYATHLSWELGWLAFHDAIANARDSAWAYPWWAYIDGGDYRYALAPPELLAMETLSVANGAVGMFALVRWLRSQRSDSRAVLLMMATAVVHLYSTSLYYGSEIAAGFPNVNTGSALDLWVKFGLANAPWIVFPWFVLYWGYRQLQRLGLASRQ